MEKTDKQVSRFGRTDVQRDAKKERFRPTLGDLFILSFRRGSILMVCGSVSKPPTVSSISWCWSGFGQLLFS